LTLKAVISIKDLLSDETQYAIKYLDIAPQVSVGINGSSYEYYYSQKDIENVQTILSGDYASVIYQWYWDAYDRNDHYGVDNNRYYADNTQFALVTSGTLKTTENRPATLESSRVIQKP